MSWSSKCIFLFLFSKAGLVTFKLVLSDVEFAKITQPTTVSFCQQSQRKNKFGKGGNLS